MELSQDYEELFKILNEYKVKYLVVGGYAVMYYTYPRFTKDMDIWVLPEVDNAERVFYALKKFGAPLRGVSKEDFMDKKLIFQIGVAPIRIDILMDIGGLDFQKAWKHKKKVKYGNVYINIIGLDELILAKQKAGRDIDLFDIKALQQNKKLKRKGFSI